MKSARAIVTWHEGLGVQREALPPELSLIWGLGTEQTDKLSSAAGTRV